MAGEAASAAAAGRLLLAAALVLAACTVPVAAQAKSEADVLNEFRAALAAGAGWRPAGGAEPVGDLPGRALRRQRDELA